MQKQKELKPSGGEVAKLKDDESLKAAASKGGELAEKLEQAQRFKRYKTMLVCNCGMVDCTVMERPLQEITVEE